MNGHVGFKQSEVDHRYSVVHEVARAYHKSCVFILDCFASTRLFPDLRDIVGGSANAEKAVNQTDYSIASIYVVEVASTSLASRISGKPLSDGQEKNDNLDDCPGN